MKSNIITAYKLVQKIDGEYYSTKVNTSQPLPKNEWLQAEYHKTDGMPTVIGWNAMTFPDYAYPKGNKVFVEVLMENYIVIKRPYTPNPDWVRGQRMKIVREVLDHELISKEHYPIKDTV